MKSIYLLLLNLLFIHSSIGTLAQQSAGPEAVSIDGKHFVTASGEKITFQGVNIRDPHELEKDGLWTKAHLEEARNWGSMVVRLPVHPVAWRERGEEAYLALLDQAVEWARELQVYLIIDWHSIGNLAREKFQHEMYETTVEETHEFWNTISERYKDEPVIAMYELFNEPVAGGERFSELSWGEWKVMNQEMIRLIRKNDPETIILVAGFNWAYDLTPVRKDPVVGTNIAYVSHPYPQKRDMPWEPQWEEDWGFVSAKYPVILTEIGFALPHEKGVHMPVKGDELYGEKLLAFCADRGISWVVWCFDNTWSPYMYMGNYEPTRQGVFFKKMMLH